MADTALHKMPADEFLAWCQDREGEKWELVFGQPLRMMTGATHRHDRIVVNLLVALANRLRGGPCAPNTDDIAVKTAAGANVRRPDVIVDCGPKDPKGLDSKTPTAVFEVLSPSNANFTRFAKVDEYKGVASVQHIIIVDHDAPRLIHHQRLASGAWSSAEIDGLGESLDLPALGVALPLAEIFADVGFGETPEA
jgi:Uma2 family endonuclease